MCQFCQNDNNDFITLNQTMEYSGLEMSMNRQGMFRVRHYDQFDDDTFTTQDMLQFKFCPYCGKRLMNGRNTI